MATAIQFRQAVKYAAKGRVALIGPAGSGKSFTALKLARLLVGPTGKIAAIDTEHGSLSKYADQFDFDVFEMDTYSPDNFYEAHRVAVEGGYAALITDSLSHFWVGKDGALEFVDNEAKKSAGRDSFAGWKNFRPHERAMVDTMVGSPLHIICTMRTKTDYQEVKDERTGKVKRVKVGLAPVQRDGLEYEFDLVGYMDDENNFIVDKTRCSALTGKVLAKPGDKEFEPFRAWLAGGAERAAVTPAPAQTTNGNGHAPQNGKASQNGNGQAHAQFHVNNNVIVCHALNVEARMTRPTKPGATPNPYRVIKMNGKIGDQVLAYCFHASLFDALDAAKDKPLQFEFEVAARDGKSITIIDVLDVAGQEYRGGKPYNASAEIPDVEPPDVGPMEGASQQSLINEGPITDKDLPAEMFAE